MLHIEPIEETITQRKLLVTIDEDEMAKILVDARPFQKMLRRQKSAWNGGHSTWSATGHADGRSRTKKNGAKRGRKNGSPKAQGRLKCQWGCGKRFTKEGWKVQHEEKCAQRDIGTVKVGD